MIVDTSALIASLIAEDGYEAVLRALIEQHGLLPAPALVEFRRVISRKPSIDDYHAETFLEDLLSGRLRVIDYTAEHARVAAAANRIYGAGNTRSGTLNLVDLMVYGCAKVTGRPILCTGRDFAATDAAIHPASRTD